MADLTAIQRIAITRSRCPLVQWEAWDDDDDGFARFASGRLGAFLPAEVGQIVRSEVATAVKIAPRRFWLLSRNSDALPRGLPENLGAELDLGEGRERVDIRTPALRDVLAQCLAVDWDRTLDRAVFAPLHRIPVMFTRESTERGTFIVPRTFAQSIVDWLEDC